MFKRTKGYFLLTMLVLTGLAGRLHTDTLTTKERRQLITELKVSRAGFIKSIEGLSDKQLNYRPGKNKPSIKDCIYKLINLETFLWSSAEAALKQERQALPKHISDDKNLVSLVTQPANFNYREEKFKSVKEALKFYKNERQEMQRYVNTSTQDVRSCIVPTSSGNFDAYQMMMLTTIYCRQYTRQIEEIKTLSKFPK